MIAPGAFIGNIPQGVQSNSFYRNVIYTSSGLQLVYMTLQPSQEIGEESHINDQYIRVEYGRAYAVLRGGEDIIIMEEGDTVIVPGGMLHNIINATNTDTLGLSVIYSPPKHPPYEQSMSE